MLSQLSAKTLVSALLGLSLLVLNGCSETNSATTATDSTAAAPQTAATEPAAPADTAPATASPAPSGTAFLAANKLKPGVVTLPDGLQYKVLTQGAGPQPTGSDTVTVNYSGTLIDGTEFDSSYKRGEPTSFPVNGVIPGWTEALKLMKTGSTWMLYIPANLAYGEQGSPPNIGPNQTLIFKVELLGIK